MKREDYITWDQYFMGIAVLSSERSKDPNTRVGACIVNDENKILSMGYNGAPIGFSDDVMPWAREGANLDTKYPYVCHSELNAILNCPTSVKGARVYVTLFPCNECAKLIVQAGIKEVLFLSDKFKDKEGNLLETDAVKASKRMFDECGVAYHEINLNTDKIEINLEKR